MEYELKLEKSPRSPRYAKDRMTPESKSKKSLSILKSPQTTTNHKDIFIFSDPSLTKSEVATVPLLSSRLTASKISRRIPTEPCQTIQIDDIDSLLTDYLYCPIDWSNSSPEIIALALDTKVLFIFPARSKRAVFRCHSADAISLRFNQTGKTIALGSILGTVRLFDIETEEPISSFNHVARPALSIDILSKTDVFVSAHQSGQFVISDFRADSQNQGSIIRKVDEICYRAIFSPDNSKLAISHSENSISIFDLRQLDKPITKNDSHCSGIHAMAWSPHEPDLIATGGGQFDKTIKIWNTQTGKVLREVSTESQVCNLFWSKTSNELISTQGYPISNNNVMFWNGSDLKLTGIIKGHNDRVMYAALSPDEATFATTTDKDPFRIWDIRQTIHEKRLQSLR